MNRRSPGSSDPLADVDPGLRQLARVLPRRGSLHRGLRVPRAVMGVAGVLGRRRGVDVVRLSPDVSVRLHRPDAPADRSPAVLWIHGGGTVMGSAAQEDRFCRALARRAGVVVAAVDHRLAPEHPYPTPLEDCHTALAWLAAQPWVDPGRAVVGGASAGGGLAAALALLARDRGGPAVAGQLLTYPMLDHRTASAPGEEVLVWHGRDNQLAWGMYLGGADPAVASPARRTDVAGLPPSWIGVGTLDLFHDESLAYADALEAADVAVALHVAPGAFHAFDQLAPRAAVSRAFLDAQVAWVRATLS